MPVKAPLPGGRNDLILEVNGGAEPNGTVYPQITGNDALTTYSHSLERIVAPHQYNSGSNTRFRPKRFYVLNVRQAKHVFHPDDPYKKGSTVWGYDGIFPGPTFMSRYGEPILVRIINGLFFDENANPTTPGRSIPGGFGDARISTHLHNGHTGSESDGNPADIYPPQDPDPSLGLPPYPASISAIKFRDHHYPMFRAGLDPKNTTNMCVPNINDGDIKETVSTLWYHDHSMDHTAQNVYKGLVGFHLFFDEFDSGNENDRDPRALRLPSGKFEIPMLFQDKRFDPNGELFLDQNARTGFLGDKFTVNGMIQPKLPVLRRKYRFRLLNAGPSRFYQFFLTKNNVDQTFQQIGNDESLLVHPEDVKSVLLSVAERADVVIDFKHFDPGDHVFLVNRLKMRDDGQGPLFDNGKMVIVPPDQADQILRFDVGDDAPDPSRVPTLLRNKPDLPNGVLTKAPDRTFIFSKKTGLWVVNDRFFDDDLRVHFPRQGPPGGAISAPDGEVWSIENSDPDWSHPIHIHLEEFQILRRNGIDPPSTEKCKKDVLFLGPDEKVQIFVRFRDFLGKYPIHCHNLIH
jgi:FtsP/CotA-like multicopper oxidase with cupredoxin domain